MNGFIIGNKNMDYQKIDLKQLIDKQKNVPGNERAKFYIKYLSSLKNAFVLGAKG